MNHRTQPRQPAGTRRGGVSTAGRFATKPKPTITGPDVEFNETVDVVDAPRDWTTRTVELWGTQTTFTRLVDSDGGVTITADCDPPDMMLLTKKADAGYWSGSTWRKDHETRRVWCADIACRMLTEGLVATEDDTAISAVMDAASSNREPATKYTPHALTGVVAQIRGLRLIQTMASTDDWRTKHSGYQHPNHTDAMLIDLFGTVAEVHHRLPQQDFDGTEQDGARSGPQPAAGYVTDNDGDDCFVGVNGDLVWRALTETDHTGLSPLKAILKARPWIPWRVNKEMIVAAALHDDTAATQLTTELFACAADDRQRSNLKTNAENVLNEALNPDHGQNRWTEEQQTRIRGFLKVVEALNP